jgi:hypothetical protein
VNNGPKKKGNTTLRHVPAPSRLSEAERQRLAQFLDRAADARAEELEVSPTDTPPGFFCPAERGGIRQSECAFEIVAGGWLHNTQGI